MQKKASKVFTKDFISYNVSYLKAFSQINMKLRTTTATVICLICLALPGLAEKMLIDGVAARINSDIITIGEVARMMLPMQQELVGKYRGDALREKLLELYSDTVNALVERRLIMAAYEEQDMQLPEWVIDERIDEVIRENFRGDKSELMEILAREKMSFEEWRETWRERMGIASMRSSFFGRTINVSPEELVEQYEANREKYLTAGKAKLKMIFLKDDGPVDGADQESRAGLAEAAIVIEKLKKGAAFSDLAREYSDGNRAESGGDWGWVEPGVLRKEIVAAIDGLKEGDVTDPVETKQGVYIVKVEGLKDERIKAYEDVRDKIESELRMKRSEVAYKAWIERLKQDAYIEIADVDLFSSQ
ncbi:hypothetical protein BVX97_02135 [bacterium E08(2017)]|nr:hypothetical protein BVX97_02135 [bacterium E08(2017)]